MTHELTSQEKRSVRLEQHERLGKMKGRAEEDQDRGKCFMLNYMGYKEITCFDPGFKIRFLIEGHIGQGRVVSKPSVQRLIVKPSRARIGTMGSETSWG